MIPLYTEKEFNLAKTQTRLPLQCSYCNETFTYRKKDILETFNPNLVKSGDFCSRKCKLLSEGKIIRTNCLNCNITIDKPLSQVKKYTNSFCSRSCSAFHFNRYKTFSFKRSKLEKYIEDTLSSTYPNLSIKYNDNLTVGLELDIFIPSLKIAFELNGITHYKPIYGQKKLDNTLKNEKIKIEACKKLNINLYILDVTKQKKFTEKSSSEFLEFITNTISFNFAPPTGVEPVITD